MNSKRHDDPGYVAGNTLARGLKWAASVVTSLAILGGALAFAGDARYVQKSEMRIEIRYSVDQLRKQTLEDKIYELTLVPETKRSNEQRALLDRYLRQLQELNTRWVNPPSGGQ